MISLKHSKLIYFPILVLLFYQCSDQTESVIKTGKQEIATKKIDSLFSQTQQFLYSDPDTARYFSIMALDLAIEANNELYESIMLNAIGVSYLIQANYGKASEYLFKALRVASNLGNQERISRTYNNLGILNRELGNYKESLSYYLKAIDLYEETGDEANTANVYNNISVLYSELNNFSKALEYNLKSLEAYQNLSDSIGIQGVLSGRGRLHMQLNNTDSAIYFLNRSVEIAMIKGNSYGLSNAYRNLANVFVQMDDFESAVYYFNESKELAQNIKVISNEAYANLGLADIYFNSGNYNLSLKHAKNVAEIATKMNNDKVLSIAHDRISKIYDQAGDIENAYHHYKKSIELKEETVDQNNLHQVYNLELEKLNESIKISQLEVQRQDLLLGKRSSAIIMITLAFAILMITLILIFSKIRQKQKMRLNDALLKHSEERSKAALDAEIQERKRLGLELHDGVGPMLSLAKLNVTALLERQALSTERKTTILNNTVSTLNEVLREMKHISHNMAPIVLIEKGFVAAVKDLVVKLNESEKYSVTLNISGLTNKLDEYLEHALYRSLLEAINNILSHAKGSEINIQITGNSEDITMMIEDNGIGFYLDGHSKRNGLGLKSTQSRIEAIKGKLFIDSLAGRGTIVTIVVPVKNNIESWSV